MQLKRHRNALISATLIGLLILLCFPVTGRSTLDFRSETMVRIFERDTEEEEKSQVVPVYEYLQFDYGQDEGQGLSFHFNGWGRLDAGDSGYFEDNPDGSLLNAYLEYVHPGFNFSTRLGRQSVATGVALDSVDGIWLGTTPFSWLGFSAFGGLPVALYSDDGRENDVTYGGRVFHRLAAIYEVGLSYRIITGDTGEDDERLAADIFLSYPGRASLSGYSTQNLVTGEWAEHTYEATVYWGDFYLKPYYQHISYEDFFNSGSISAQPFRFLSDTGEVLDLIGGEVTWKVSGGLDVGARYNYYDYDIRDKSSNFAAGLINGRIGEALLGAEVGRMEGGSKENNYLLTRGFFYWDRLSENAWIGTLTGDAVYVLYDEEIFNKNSSLFVSLGVGRGFLEDRLEVRLSGDYSSDPYFDSDLRGMVKVIFKR